MRDHLQIRELVYEQLRGDQNANQVIHIAADGAEARVTGYFHRFRPDEASPAASVFGRYLGHFEKQGQAWVSVHWSVRYDEAAGYPEGV